MHALEQLGEYLLIGDRLVGPDVSGVLARFNYLSDELMFDVRWYCKRRRTMVEHLRDVRTDKSAMFLSTFVGS
jgi:hypothetical protein